MGFLLGSSCLSQSPFCQSLYPPSFLCSSQIKNAKKKISAMASLDQDNPTDNSFLRRRAFLLAGLSAFPFLQSRARARAAENLVTGKGDMRMAEDGPGNLDNLQEISFLQEDQPEQVHQQGLAANPFVALLNGLGIIGLGVLGALYALAQKEKTAIESTIESMKTKLSEKEAAMALREKNFEKRLRDEQEEKFKQIRKAKEDQVSFSNQLTSAKSEITGLRRELQNDKKIVQELKVQMDQLQSGLEQAGEDKKFLEAKLLEKHEAVDALQERINLLSLEVRDKEKNIDNLKSLLVEKESEYKNLNFICTQAEADLAETNSEIKGLKEEVLKTREELELERSSVCDLNARIKSVLAERDDLDKQMHTLKEEYSDLKSSYARRVASDSEILSNKDHELHLLKEKLDLAYNEASSNHELIADLKTERDSFRASLENEANNMNKLRGELQITQGSLEASTLEAADLSKQLKQSKRLCEELTSEISRIQSEFANAQKSLTTSLNEAESSSKVMSDELVSIKEVLKKTKEELVVMSDEVKAVIETREQIKKELVDIYKKAEITSHDLKEEKKVVASLNRELEASRKQIMEDKEARRTLEKDLEEATKSLDEMNKNALLLSRELKMTNSRSSSLEAEKEMLYKSLTDQKYVAKEARENLEDAQNLLVRLGNERESLEKRGKKLEEELTAAKGEILRLRSEKKLTRVSVNEQQQRQSSENEGRAPVVTKRNGRRRKGGSTSEISQ
ncbi:MAR binding filament-like protein 1 [Tasmannia lanceolata]|uniref:MAR binding filament-like protein 1 n=1 Tax=Tasmannia lanceolata TaxID=3420 RepID=UPI004062DC20